jgi:hypothetical protein
VNARRALAVGYTSLRDLGGREQIDVACAAARYQLSMGVDILKFVASSIAYASPDQGVQFWPELGAYIRQTLAEQRQASYRGGGARRAMWE